MFKLLFVAFAVAAADPQLLLSPSYTSSYLEPATTTITRQTSSVNTPFFYPGFDHLIKKRAAQFYNSYLGTGKYWDPELLPLSHPLYTPAISAAHLIKKRDVMAPFAPIMYTHPGFTYSAIPGAMPLVSPYDNLHFIKKRQAVWSGPINYDAPGYSSVIIPEAPLWSSYAPGFPFIKK